VANDRDAVILDQLLIARPGHAIKANVITIQLEGTTDLTEKGVEERSKTHSETEPRTTDHLDVKVASQLQYVGLAFVANVINYSFERNG
jgi:hypothetical protein